MTDEELTAIKVRAEAAAPGPWTLRKGDLHTIEGTDPPHYRVMSRFLATDEDTAFIIHAREDIPALLAEVERLRAREAALMAVVKKVAEAYQPTKYSYGSVSSRTVERAHALVAADADKR